MNKSTITNKLLLSSLSVALSMGAIASGAAWWAITSSEIVAYADGPGNCSDPGLCSTPVGCPGPDQCVCDPGPRHCGAIV